ncbi:MAG: hypothetical protein AABW49_01605 [Nanoarchaeota archaeon]
MIKANNYSIRFDPEDFIPESDAVYVSVMPSKGRGYILLGLPH